MWALILIQIILNSDDFLVDNQLVGVYDDINKCFVEREILIEELHYLKGNEPISFPPPNTQLVCVRIEND